ncbi:uncharacterized protein LOC111288550 isoform X2 [Durio zibethinus]|uniref:Uncharacterized protein LOC111288550 isoform X2 n=1 Tax=Durio zibethinus TaxID=66656 RepID=A0A6P5Y483_DURZI|nr:uncharacterized protein LOC111288550 isoform X2 [Durio zibethinus]
MAAAFCLSAASNAVGTLMVEYLVRPVERGFRYLFRFNKIVEELKLQEKNLSKEQTRVMQDVEEAKRHVQTQVIEQYVEDWLTDAENVFKDVQSLERRIEENKRCFLWCPNWSCGYPLSKKIERQTVAIKELVKSSKFDRVGHRATLPGIEFFSPKDLVASKSSTSAFNEIMEALKNDEVNMIAVWGMGGVGKTTLVTEVGKKAKELELFHKVIKAVVSQTPIIENIQVKIADFLDLKFEKMGKEGKAEELWLGLKKEEKVLIILDDMWDELNLKEIGIPLRENHKGCKIILTTRRKKVCESMASQVTVSLGVLDEGEAWTLFKTKASLDEGKDHAHTIEVAMNVAKECKGLPVAIVTLARALKGTKTVKGWEVALDKLKNYRLMEIGNVEEEAEKNVYMCLKISYDYLRKETTKRCFLLCALYPEDYSIDVEALVRHAWGLKIYSKAASIEEARFEVLEAIDYLKDSSLLLADTERYVKLHDMVRDVALWVASKEESDFMIKPSLGLANESLEPCNAISLLDGEKKKFPKGLVCPKLEILLLKNCHTSNECFQEMKELRVLSLVKPYRWEFSLNSLMSLRKLRALHVENFYGVEDFSSLGNLTTLEILSLRGSEVQELADEFGNLKNLKVLDLTNCKILSRFPPNLIRSFYQLEELYIKGLEIASGKASTAILPELRFLSRLEALYLELPFLHIPNDFEFPRLQRYEIAIKERSSYRDKPVTSSRSSLQIEGGFPLNVILELLWKIEFLKVSDMEDEYVECLNDKTQQKVPVSLILQNLKEVKVESCENLLVVFQMEKVENHASLHSSLERLYLKDLSHLRCIWELPTHISLGRLVDLKLIFCPSLKSLFSLSVAQSLVLLEYLQIKGCGELKQIVTESEGVEEEISSTINSHTSLCFPKLTYVEIDKCDGLEYIFPRMMAPQGFPQLENLYIINCHQLKQVFRPAKERDENDTMLPRLKFLTSLMKLTVISCPLLTDSSVHFEAVKAELEEVRLSAFKELFSNTKELILRRSRVGSHNLVPDANGEGLCGLTSLLLEYCEDLECLVDTTTMKVPTSAFTDLVELVINDMVGLKILCKGQPPQGFLQNLKILKVENCRDIVSLSPTGKLQNMQQLVVRDCRKLQVVFQTSFSPGLPKLESVSVSECPQLEQVFYIEAKEQDGVEHGIMLRCLKHLQLDRLTNLSSFGPQNYFFEAPILENLRVSECPRFTNFSIQKLNKRVDLKGVRLSVFKESLCKTEDLTLSRINMDHKNLVADADLEGLTTLKLMDCKDLECLVDSTNEHVPTSGIFTNLVELVMENMIGLEMLCKGQPPKGFLRNLEILTVRGCKDIVSLSPMERNLKKLTVEQNGRLQEIFRIDEFLYNREENQAPLLSNLDFLRVWYLPELKWILKGPAHYVSLRSLKIVNIRRCNELKSLFSASIVQTLRLLEELVIGYCDKLEHVFLELESDDDQTESDTLCLPNLKTLDITGCPRLEYVFPNTLAQGFPCLQNLKFRKLTNLNGFVAENYFVKLPALKKVDVIDCPPLTNFTIQQEVDKPIQLKELVICFEFKNDVELCNTQLRQRSPNLEYINVGKFEQLFQLRGGYFISSLEKMRLVNLIWLRDIWKGLIQVVTNLRKLEVDNCSKLTCIFPIMLIQNFPQLTFLRILRCDNLEQIIGNDNISASSSKGHDQDETGVKSEKELLMLSRLQEVDLVTLPRLVSFGPVGYHLVFPSLCFLKIEGCSQMTTNFTVDSTLTVHAKKQGRTRRCFTIEVKNCKSIVECKFHLNTITNSLG